MAELLLRKTTAKQVQQIYLKVINQYPSPYVLSKASHSVLREIIRPLGMENTRTELLIKLGKELVEKYGGALPNDFKKLTTLPGVGQYAASAVLSFSFGCDVAVVDTNVIRILQRFFNIKSAKARAREDPSIRTFANELVPTNKSKVFNYAVLDFGAEICTALKPKCSLCPLTAFCIFFNKVENKK